MSLGEQGETIAIIGAAGKMGRGISQMLVQEVCRAECEKRQDISCETSRIQLIDSNEEMLFAFRRSLKDILRTFAEKNIQTLRSYALNNKYLVSNEDVIEAFVNNCLESIQLSTDLNTARNASLIFEAAAENIEIKSRILKTLAELCSKDTFFFSNTSSIPISFLAEKAKLNGRIIGLHFYNPAPVQKLLEVVIPKGTLEPLVHLAEEIGRRLNKHAVPSADISGFIGNGHMIREMGMILREAEALSNEYPLEEAVYLFNRVYQVYLLRPMGLFQLMDFVGLDICSQIATVMEQFLEQPIRLTLCEKMLEKGIKGGLSSEGKQQPGFFSYKGKDIEGIYNWQTSAYELLSADKIERWNSVLGAMPEDRLTWKQLSREDLNRETKINKHFYEITTSSELGCAWAKKFLGVSADIAELLVKDKVAAKIEDVDTVLELGFHHLYAPRRALNFTKDN